RPGHELNDHERPVRGGHERPALQCRFQSGSHRHYRHSTIAGVFAFLPEGIASRTPRHALARSVAWLTRCRSFAVFSDQVAGTPARQSGFPGERRVSAARIFAGGCALAAAAVLIGFLVEFYRLGTSDAVAAASLEQDVRAEFASMTDHLVAVAH